MTQNIDFLIAERSAQIFEFVYKCLKCPVLFFNAAGATTANLVIDNHIAVLSERKNLGERLVCRSGPAVKNKKWRSFALSERHDSSKERLTDRALQIALFFNMRLQFHLGKSFVFDGVRKWPVRRYKSRISSAL